MAAHVLHAYRPPKALTEYEYDSSGISSVASSAAFSPVRRAFVVPAAQCAARYVVTSTELPPWVEPTLSGFSAIHCLEENWNADGAKKISNDLIRQSLTTLAQIMEISSPVPSIVPLSDGGLQIEWHRRQQDLEIVFSAEEAPNFFYENRINGVQEGGYASDIARLIQLLRNIA